MPGQLEDSVSNKKRMTVLGVSCGCFLNALQMLQLSVLHSGQTMGRVLLDKNVIVDKATETWDQLPYQCRSPE